MPSCPVPSQSCAGNRRQRHRKLDVGAIKPSKSGHFMLISCHFHAISLHFKGSRGLKDRIGAVPRLREVPAHLVPRAHRLAAVEEAVGPWAAEVPEEHGGQPEGPASPVSGPFSMAFPWRLVSVSPRPHGVLPAPRWPPPAPASPSAAHGGSASRPRSCHALRDGTGAPRTSRGHLPRSTSGSRSG